VKEVLRKCKDIVDESGVIKASLLDLTVPGELGGKEIVSELHNCYHAMKIFAASGYSTDPIIANPQEFGFTASLQKPYKFNELSEMLNRYFPDSASTDSLL